MNKSLVKFFVSISFLLVGVFGFSQNADNSILGIENGFIYAYNLNTDNLGTGTEYAMHLTVSDDIQAGFSYITGDGVDLPSAALLKLSYFVKSDLGVTVITGNSAGGLLSGAGIFYNIFTNTVGQVDVDLKVRMDYLVNSANPVGEGLILTTLCAKIGI